MESNDPLTDSPSSEAEPAPPAPDEAGESARPQRTSAFRQPSSARGMIWGALYLLAFVAAGLGWLLYANAKGYSSGGVMLTPLFGVTPLVLLCEGARQVRAGEARLGGVWLVLGLAMCAYVLSGSLVRSMLFPSAGVRGVPAALPEGVERVEYRSADGVPHVGVAARAEAQLAVAVYFHGNAEGAGDNASLARELAKVGLSVFVAEFRGYADSPGASSEAGLLVDGRAAVAEACARFGVEPGDLILVGRSLGTGVASAMAAEGVGRRVVLLSPYTSIRSIASRMVPAPMAWLAVRDVFDSRTRLGGVEHPVLVVHGDRDRVVPTDEGRALAESLGERARLVLLEGTGHNDLLAGRNWPRVRSEIVDFVAR